jgi:hypothetical protein
MCTRRVIVEEKRRSWYSFCSSWAPESEYALHPRIHWPTFGFSQFKGNSEGKMRFICFRRVIVEEKRRSWYSFCSSWAPDSEYVLHSRIHWPRFGFSQFKGNSESKMRFICTRRGKVEEKRRFWYSFCSSWAPEFEYVLHSRIHWPTFGFSQFKGNSEGKMRFMFTRRVIVEEKRRSWYSFCSSWAPESEYVLHFRIHWPTFGFSQFKGNSEGKMRFMFTRRVIVEEKRRSWYSFCSSWAPESEYVLHSRIHWPTFGFSQFKGNSDGKMRFICTRRVIVEEKRRC